MAKKKPKSDQTTLVTFLLDRSQSMTSCRDSTIEAFNGYIAELRNATTPILFTFLQFDHFGSSCDIAKVCFEKAPKDVPDLTKATYQPRGSTPLIEAAMKTIQALDTAIAGKTDKPKVVVCIQTDGEENQSGREYSWEALKALIEAKTKEGWQFNFMGAGIDAYDQGQKMGMTTANTMSYDHMDKHATRAAFAASARNTSLYASGVFADTGYSATQKRASGDKFDPHGSLGAAGSLLRPGAASLLNTRQPLDLTASGGSAPVVKSADLDLSQ